MHFFCKSVLFNSLKFVFVLWDLNLAIWKEIICLLSFLQLTIFLLDYIQSTRSRSKIKRKLICHRCRWKEFDLNIWWDCSHNFLLSFQELILCDIFQLQFKILGKIHFPLFIVELISLHIINVVRFYIHIVLQCSIDKFGCWKKDLTGRA